MELNEEGNSSLYENLVFVYKQLDLLRDTCDQLQKDNELLRKAIIGLQKHALRS